MMRRQWLDPQHCQTAKPYTNLYGKFPFSKTWRKLSWIFVSPPNPNGGHLLMNSNNCNFGRLLLINMRHTTFSLSQKQPKNGSIREVVKFTNSLDCPLSMSWLLQAKIFAWIFNYNKFMNDVWQIENFLPKSHMKIFEIFRHNRKIKNFIDNKFICRKTRKKTQTNRNNSNKLNFSIFPSFLPTLSYTFFIFHIFTQTSQTKQTFSPTFASAEE